jgi:hypothetical protein
MAKRSHKPASPELQVIRRALDKQLKVSEEALRILMEMYRDLGLPSDCGQQEPLGESPMKRTASGIPFVRCPSCANAVCSGMILSVTEAMAIFEKQQLLILYEV